MTAVGPIDNNEINPVVLPTTKSKKSSQAPFPGTDSFVQAPVTGKANQTPVTTPAQVQPKLTRGDLKQLAEVLENFGTTFGAAVLGAKLTTRAIQKGTGSGSVNDVA